MSRDRIEAVVNRVNQRILQELAVEPSYARRLAQVIGTAESEISRRLRRLEELGIVESSWEHIGKNVKMYRLVVEEVAVRFDPEGVHVRVTDLEDRTETERVAGPEREGLPETDGFVGRDEELDLLTGEEAVVVVVGMPGIGKSQLLARYARQIPGDRRLLWHRFRGPESLIWLARRIASVAGPELRSRLLERIPQGPEPVELVQAIRDVLDAGDLVLILDDVDRIEDDDLATLVEDLVRDPPPAKVVVAARERPRYDPSREGVAVIRLEGLDDEAVAEVLADHGHDPTDTLLRRIRDEVGGHPLALNLLLEAASGHEGGLDAILDRVPESDLEAYLLDELHDQLSDAERSVLALASLFHDLFTADDLAVLTDRRVEPILFTLRRRSLVLASEEGHRLHETVRNFYYELLEDRASRHAALARHLADRGDLEARLEAMDHWLRAGRPERVFRMIREDLDLEEVDYVGAGYQHLYRRVLDRLDPDDAPDAHTRALVHDEIGDVHLVLGEPDVARDHHEEAWSHFAGDGDEERVADLAWKRALALRDLGETERAVDLCKRGLDSGAEGRARRRLERLADELDPS